MKYAAMQGSQPTTGLVDRLVYIGAGAFVLFCGLFVLGEYQNQGGDFGQYITQARNVVWGRPWSHLMEGYPAVLPGYSLVLAIPTALLGLNFHAYAIINAIAWSGLAVISYRYYAPRLAHPATRIAFFVAVLCCPFVFSYQQQTNPIFLYAASVIFALAAANSLTKPDSRWPKVLLVVLLLLPGIIRTDSVALYAAVFTYYLFARHWRLLAWPLCGLILTVALDLFIGLRYEQESNFDVLQRVFNAAAPTENGAFDASRMIGSVAYMLTGYINALSYTTLPSTIYNMGPLIQANFGTELEISVSAPAFLLFSLCAVGMLRGRLNTADKLFFAAHLAMLSVFLLLGTTRHRYVLPLVPIFLFYSIAFVEFVMIRLLRALPLHTVDLTKTIAPISLGGADRRGYRCGGQRTCGALPKEFNHTVTPELTEVVDLVAAEDVGAGIAFFKPRPMTMLLDGRAASIPDASLEEHGSGRGVSGKTRISVDREEDWIPRTAVTC